MVALLAGCGASDNKIAADSGAGGRQAGAMPYKVAPVYLARQRSNTVFPPR